MQSCNVLIIGGGPAGSSCAWGLRQSGLSVVVMDRAQFPRHKTCAGWVTPPVWDMLDIDKDDYAARRTLQPIRGFRTGLLGGPVLETHYPDVVSYGIRRCEFDHYLLERCGAELMTGCQVTSMERDGKVWVVNDELTADVVIGAGGNFCPVARLLGRSVESAAPLVTAQEIEFEVGAEDARRNHVQETVPELYFCEDLGGYGWCFRKGTYLNIGLGHTDPRRMKGDLSRLCTRLQAEGRVLCPIPSRMHGHAYRLCTRGSGLLVAEGALLIGDSAGLADPHSGEGIRPAIESGLTAARILQEAGGDYRLDRLRPYESWLWRRFPRTAVPRQPSLTGSMQALLGRTLMRSRWFTRHVLLDHWFLHRSGKRPLAVHG